MNGNDDNVFLLHQMTIAALQIHLDGWELGRNKEENGRILFLNFRLICSKNESALARGFSFRMMVGTFILQEIRRQGLFLCLLDFI